MMKRLMVWLMMAVLLVTGAAAESLHINDYTDVPTAMTQDSVTEILVQPEGYAVETLQPDEKAIALLNQVYAFVREEEQRPARFYDEETQQKIADLAKCDIDALHMTEAMSLQLSILPVEAQSAPEAVETVEIAMHLNVEYREGQLVIVVLGVQQEDGSYVWQPYRGQVDTLGEIKWTIPAEAWEMLSQQPVSFHVLTDRIGPRGEQLWVQPAPTASKTAQDVIGMRYWYTVAGEAVEDTFRVWLTDLTDEMLAEVLRIGVHVGTEQPLLDYFPQERKDEAMFMLPEGVDASQLHQIRRKPRVLIGERQDNFLYHNRLNRYAIN